MAKTTAVGAQSSFLADGKRARDSRRGRHAPVSLGRSAVLADHEIGEIVWVAGTWPRERRLEVRRSFARDALTSRRKADMTRAAAETLQAAGHGPLAGLRATQSRPHFTARLLLPCSRDE